jgi:hypothetical protein
VSKGLYEYQEENSGSKWQTYARLKLLSAGKIGVQASNPQKCGEFLHAVPPIFGPNMQGKRYWKFA